jgi:hypothetical protein
MMSMRRFIVFACPAERQGRRQILVASSSQIKIEQFCTKCYKTLRTIGSNHELFWIYRYVYVDGTNDKHERNLNNL